MLRKCYVTRIIYLLRVTQQAGKKFDMKRFASLIYHGS